MSRHGSAAAERHPIASLNRRGRIAYGLRRQHGLSVIGWLLMIPAALIVLLILVIGFYEGRKAYWDAQVREMCARDGGVTIFEQIVISAAQAVTLPKVGGFFGVAPEALAKLEEPAFIRNQSIQIREGNPSVVRDQQEIIRRSDGRVVGLVVRYGRGGGDFPSHAHPSEFSCPDYISIYKGIHGVYHVEEMKK